ncbi:MAG TPA: YeeE/YedE family protein [Chloroflexota bacterium]
MSQQAIAAPAGGQVLLGRTLLALLAVLVLAVVVLLLAAQDGGLALSWVFGLGTGFVLQRSRFCFASAFRDLFLLRDARMMKAVVLGLAVATGGFALYQARLVPDPSVGSLPPQAHVVPVGLHLVVGGVVFGIGMVIGGGCVSGNLYRIGEGYVGSVVAVGGMLVGLLLAAHTWNWWWLWHIGQQPVVWLPRVLGYGGAVALTLALLAALFVALLWWESSQGPGLPVAGRRRAETPAFTFSAKVRQLWRTVFVHGWPAALGGAALGAWNVFNYLGDHPLGVTGELAVWSDRIARAFALGAPPLLGVDQFAGCNLVSGGAGIVTHTFLLDTGIVLGSFVAAVLAGEFKVRVPPRRSRYLQALGGGVLMGYGAGLAIGCTIGAFFSAVPSLGLNGWVFGASLALGSFVGVKLLRRLP